MPVRPFPYQLGIGTDVVAVKRICAILERNIHAASDPSAGADRFLRRFLTRSERKAVWKRFGDPECFRRDEFARHVAGRWAAKEAAIKAVTWKKIGPHHVIIQKAPTGLSLRAVILDQDARERESDAAENEHQCSAEARHHRAHHPLPRPVLSSDEPNRSDFTGAAVEPLADSAATTESRSGDSDDPDSQADRDLSGQMAKISISHDGEYAFAVCLAAEETMEGDVGGEATARGW